MGNELLTRDAMARAAFEEIRDQPYRLPEFPGDIALNCFVKGNQLLEKLGCLGYSVRGRIGEFEWTKSVFPSEIVSLYPTDLLTTHYFIEIEVDGAWRCLDPSWDSRMEAAGFAIASWTGENCPGLPIERLYDFEKQASYLKLCQDAEYANNWFQQAMPFFKRANQWLKSCRAPSD